MKKNTSWGSVAQWYDALLEDKDSYQSQVILPNLLRLVAPKKNMTILDLACGNGFFSKALIDAGASVTGVDISAELVALAKEHVPNATFLVSPAHDLKALKDQTFDAIVCVLAIQNIKEVKETFAEAARVLKTGGKMLLVMNHPAFRIPGGSSWGWDDAAKKQYRRIDEYLVEKVVEIVMHPGKAASPKTVSFHRPLQYYAKLLQSSGFVMSRIEEWNSHKKSEAGPRQAEEDRMRKQIPLFVLIEAEKR